MSVQTSSADLWGIMHRRTVLVAAAMYDVAEASLANDSGQEMAAVDRLADLLYHSAILGELLGRRRMLLEADAVRSRNKPLDGMILFEGVEDVPAIEIAQDSPVVPHQTFEEAVRSITDRDPRVISPELMEKYRLPDGKLPPRHVVVQQLYSKENAFALARASNLKVTANIQKTLERFMNEGRTLTDAKGGLMKQAILDGQKDWSAAYAETVYRTNVNTAYTRGMVEMAKDPAVSEVIGGFHFHSINDGATRSNHRAANGLIAGVHDPLWESLTPPLGYNCRCALRLVGRDELERKGLIEGNMVLNNSAKLPRFGQAEPDPGFNPG